MNRSKAVIVIRNRESLRVAAASARISTQQGTALEIFDKSLGDEKDLRLIDKVLSSGHKSVIEHQNFGIAFNDVSVLVEQFVIECRLASYTVKSRRYVDFGDAGWVCPDHLTDGQKAHFDATMRARFEDYRKLMELGVPKEDARFVLPYSLRSNFFMTVNARELIQLICAMRYGRGAGFAEIEQLGRQLSEQFDEMYPGVIERECKHVANCAPAALPGPVEQGKVCEGDAKLIGTPCDAKALLDRAIAFGGRFDGVCPELVLDARPRELEVLNYTFDIKDISLSCLTHFARHRIQSPIIPPVLTALARGHYVLPETVRDIPEAETVYHGAFKKQADAATVALSMGMSREDASYFALSGHEIDIMLTMNARELNHFMKLRTCSRAQWEIRGVAMKMLNELRTSYPELFDMYGASCRCGECPEGRMCCGNPWPRIKA